jgi:SAM-dependent methyltransferase
MLASLSIDDAPPAELSAYLTEDFERFVITWSLARNATGRALEIGANPYFTTILLRELTSLDLTLTNFFAPDDPAVVRAQSVEYRDLAGTTTRRQMPYRPVNVESDRFPFDDGAFDIVFFCEVIEHLQTDPIVAIDEIHRVLRPGGRLVLTTPNVARLENVARLVAGANLYDPYSGYGAYGRHNREFTRHELHRVLDYRGFANIESFTSDVHDHRAGNFVDVDSLAELVADRQPDLGQYIFVTAERARLDPDRAARRPSFLYRSMPAGVIEEYE